MMKKIGIHFVLVIALTFSFFSVTAQDANTSSNVTDTNLTAQTDSIMLNLEDSADAVLMRANELNKGIVIPTKYAIWNFEANVVPKGDAYQLEITALDSKTNRRNELVTGLYPFVLDGEDINMSFVEGKAKHKLAELPSTAFLKHNNGSQERNQFLRFAQGSTGVEVAQIPLWLSIIPPLIAIGLALLFREVLASLFIGIWSGAFILSGFSLQNMLTSFLTVVDKYIVNSLADTDHIAIIVFSALIGAMVAIISKNGGMAGVVNRLASLASSARSSQFATWFLGVAIFFDDYANSLIVGNTMRSLTDKYRVSREKLAYIVDSTAAPVAAIALITTWIGAELGYISDATSGMGIEESSYSIFLNSLAYSFYPILTLAFILILVFSKRDFGPMYRAEYRARTTGKLFNVEGEGIDSADMDEMTPVKGKPQRAYNAILPVLTVIIATMVGLIYTGYDEAVWNDSSQGFFDKMQFIIGNSNSYTALLWSSILGVFVAIVLTIGGNIMNLRHTMESVSTGIKTMLGAIIILVLAWALAQVTKDLHTADFLTSILQDNFDPRLMPIITFIMAGIIAFSTGSSWSTMAILYPLLLPATYALCQSAGIDQELTMAIFYNVTSSVLAGSVFGDHCSPISDTTILSSMATNCNHIDHVRTQMPYAITVGLVSIGMSYLSIYVGLPNYLNFIIGFGLLLLIVLVLGKSIPEGKMYDHSKEELASRKN